MTMKLMNSNLSTRASCGRALWLASGQSEPSRSAIPATKRCGGTMMRGGPPRPCSQLIRTWLLAPSAIGRGFSFTGPCSLLQDTCLALICSRTMGAQAGLLLLASLLLASQALALRPSNSLRVAIKEKQEEGAQTAVAPVKAYKNTKPLIGVLTQPCHDCPGK